ncbi:MAG: hypothetical protein FJ213_06570 [Ignavibacteria bacterium]|nr:hypothetical protein [Ignavibacteria bacterium]
MHRQIEIGLHSELIEQIEVYSGDIENGKINFIQIDEKEFKLNGKLYDIVKIQVFEDRIIYHCINDTKEEELEHQLVKFIFNNFNGNEIPIPIKNSIQILNLDAISEQSFILNHNLIECEYYLNLTYSLNEVFIDIPSPPPKSLHS